MAITAANTYPVGGILTEQVASLYDFFKPQVTAELFARFETQYMPMFQWLKAMGREFPVAADSWYGWEENWWHETIKVASAAPIGGAAGEDPGTGNDINVTLHEDSVNASNMFYARLGDIITIPGTEVQASVWSIDVTTPTAPVLRLKPISETSNIGIIAANTILSITNGAFGAGTKQPDGTVVGSTKRTFYAQIQKESVGAEGSQLVNELWYSKTSDGRNVTEWYTPGTMRAEYLLGLKWDGAYTFGQENTNATLIVPTGVPGAGNKITTTKGLVPWIRDLGKVMTTDPLTWAITDLDDVGLYYKSQAITTGAILWMIGAKLNNTVENKAKTYLDNTGVDFTSIVNTYFNGDKSLALSVDFSVIRKGGLTFIKKPMDVWSNPKTFGATGYNMDEYGIMGPLRTVRNPNTGARMMNIASRYRALGNYSRRFEVWSVRGAGVGLKVTDVDREDTYLRSHQGLQVYGANQFILQDPN